MKNMLAQTALAAAALAVSPHPAQAAEGLYRITDLGVLGCGTYCSSVATDVNNLGQIVGQSTTAGGTLHAALWTPDGGALDLGTTYGSSTSAATSINNLGQAVGYSGSKAFYWDTRVGMWELSFATASSGVTYAAAINDQGVVTGATFDNLNNPTGFRWRQGFPVQTLPALGKLDGTASSRAVNINNEGDIVGYATTTSGLTSLVWQHNGIMQPLNFSPSDINDQGHMVGTDDAANGVYFDGVGIRAVSSPSGGRCELTDLNSANVLLGRCGGRAAVGSADGLSWLDTLIDPTDPLKGTFKITQANAINDLGQIVGSGLFGNKSHAFLLTPVPEPTTHALLLAGVASLGWCARRRAAKRAQP